ncbi:hypothetical protein C0Q70_20189 [Pomacea canaliculata]|uniref:Laccase n=1 Tax=Pomacea canaliculata TaxID=400727 RepID=A0A2T7NEV1_POMCA|nr:hypothetical protein C0Q70_20189 [Pomacea canaliculata]
MVITWTVAAFILCGCGLTTALTMLDSMSDYVNHPCVRQCEEGIPNRRCEYHWTLEMYYVLSKACYDCPFNLTDCSRPHCVPADGTSRGILTANRRIPGPGIQVCHGDEIIVNVYNKLENSQGTSIHWHGLLQRGSQYMDGTSMVTQCPITTHSTFQYRFTAKDRGTHFWHSHAGLQRADGLFGSLIVRQPPSHDIHSPLYDFDLPEHVIIVTDWLNELVTSRFASHHHDDGDNKAESMLINGKGAFTPHTDPTTGARVFTPYADFTVRPTFRYRFRVISSGIMNCPIQFSIDNHTLIVIASDGGDFDPIIVDSFNIFSGERFDFILIADKTEELKNYWVRARGIADCSVKKSQQLAVLRYTGAPPGLPELATNYEAGNREGITLNPLNARATDTLVSVNLLNSTEPDDDSLKQVPDKRFYLAMDFNQVDNFHFHHPGLYPLKSVIQGKHLYSPQINHISFSSTAVPPLTQMKDIDEDATFCNNETVQEQCDKQFCECSHRLKVALNDVVELIIIDEGLLFNANHPMHLHGYKFRVVGMDREDNRRLE